MQRRAIEARFPHFLEVFKYDHSGSICDVNTAFTWTANGISYDYISVVEYIRDLILLYEGGRIAKYTDVKLLTWNIGTLLTKHKYK